MIIRDSLLIINEDTYDKKEEEEKLKFISSIVVFIRTSITLSHVRILLDKCVKIECWWGVGKLEVFTHTNYYVRGTVWQQKQST